MRGGRWETIGIASTAVEGAGGRSIMNTDGQRQGSEVQGGVCSMYWCLNNAAEGRAERRAERRATGGCFLDPSARKQRKNPPSASSQAPRTGQDGFRRRDWALQLNSRRLVAKHQRRKHPQHPASLPPLACPALLLSACLPNRGQLDSTAVSPHFLRPPRPLFTSPRTTVLRLSLPRAASTSASTSASHSWRTGPHSQHETTLPRRARLPLS